jgi:hypothetical protein
VPQTSGSKKEELASKSKDYDGESAENKEVDCRVFSEDARQVCVEEDQVRKWLSRVLLVGAVLLGMFEWARRKRQKNSEATPNIPDVV